jgi:pyruvate formate lyase activating enzyme
MHTGIIFNIKKFAIHDGPGIRTTVFLKGCPLRCRWCHNPESQQEQPEIVFDSQKCIQSYQCISACPNQAIEVKDGYPYTDKKKCQACGDCIDICPGHAREITGKKVTSGEVLEEIKKDLIFYQESGGGVTFSGGEPLLQIDFLEELLSSCREAGIRIAIDTCGYAPWSHFKRIVHLVDLWLYDVKVLDLEKHKKYTGVSNRLILENLRQLSRETSSIEIRIPIIPGMNDSSGEVEQMAELIHFLKINKVSLLPFHRMGLEKYSRLGLKETMKDFSEPSEDHIEELCQVFQNRNLQVEIGG